MKYYAGIGSRRTPYAILVQMKVYARELEQFGFILRSGGADGADSAFAQSVRPQNRRIYLPWRGFNGVDGIVVGDDPRLAQISEEYYPVSTDLDRPTWKQLRPSIRALHTRNAAQVLGHSSEPVLSSFVLCWTPRGKGGGGTGQAIRIAKGCGVPVYDLADLHNTFQRDWIDPHFKCYYASLPPTSSPASSAEGTAPRSSTT
jgi:hypothetical protein